MYLNDDCALGVAYSPIYIAVDHEGVQSATVKVSHYWVSYRGLLVMQLFGYCHKWYTYNCTRMSIYRMTALARVAGRMSNSAG